MYPWRRRGQIKVFLEVGLVDELNIFDQGLKEDIVDFTIIHAQFNGVIAKQKKPCNYFDFVMIWVTEP